MISFEMPEEIKQQVDFTQSVARKMMRSIARYYDENEHQIPWDYVNLMWEASLKTGRSFRSGATRTGDSPSLVSTMLVHTIESLSWGDAGIYLCTPGAGLGGAAVEATGTREQKERFLAKYREGKPKWASMAMTEPHCGSDTAAIKTTAVRSGDFWVLNGEKIFVTGGHKSMIDSDGFMVVWATVDPSAGRAGMKPFVVEAGTPGVTITKLEHKLGIRASDTAAVLLENCRLPLDSLLGSPEVVDRTKGFKGAMATFDATRPSVAASALGIARATIEHLKELLAQEGIVIRYQHAAKSTVCHRKGCRGDGSAASGGLAAHVEGGLADGPAIAEYNRGLHVQGEGRRSRDPRDSESRRADGTAGILPKAALRKVDARCQD